MINVVPLFAPVQIFSPWLNYQYSEFLPLYFITNTGYQNEYLFSLFSSHFSPPLIDRPISLPLFVNNAKGLYIHTISIR